MDCIILRPWNPEELPKDSANSSMPPTVPYGMESYVLEGFLWPEIFYLVSPCTVPWRLSGPQVCRGSRRCLHTQVCTWLLFACFRFHHDSHLSQELQNWVLTVQTRNWFYLLYDKTSMIEIQRRQWQPIPVLLPGKSHGRRSLVGCSPWCP